MMQMPMAGAHCAAPACRALGGRGAELRRRTTGARRPCWSVSRLWSSTGHGVSGLHGRVAVAVMSVLTKRLAGKECRSCRGGLPARRALRSGCACW